MFLLVTKDNNDNSSNSSSVNAEKSYNPQRVLRLPIKSEGTLPLLNLPVGFLPMKSLPYGGKLHLTIVLILLLLPGSTIESPKTITAGIVSFSGSVTAAALWYKNKTMMIKKTLTDELDEGRSFWKRKFIAFSGENTLLFQVIIGLFKHLHISRVSLFIVSKGVVFSSC